MVQSGILRNIPKSTLQTGRTAVLNCPLTNPQHYHLFWLRREKTGKYTPISADTTLTIINPDVGNGQVKYEVRMRNNGANIIIYTLIIRSVKEEDAGKYRCQIGIPNLLDPPFADAVLVVQRAPWVVDGTGTPIYTREGVDYEMACYAEGTPKPSITWSKPNGKPLKTGQFKAYGDHFVIKNVTREDRGIYRCTATNNVPPPNTNDIELRVFYAPFARPFRTTIGQMPDKNYKAELDCIVSGYPDPKIRWYMHGHDGSKQLIERDSKHYVVETTPKGASDLKQDEKWCTLIITNLQSGNFGNYSCEGVSPLGKHSAVITLYSTPTCQGRICPMESILSSGQRRLANGLMTSLIAIVIAVGV
ncbi:lachesin-like [Tubulanus polymorphus]|uniref:lachesin-like n=1 Tax=Tubulanus polymorphus TaxID=672921 RepID=UPI003DA2E9AD